MISIITLCWGHCEDITKPFVKNFLEKTKGDFELILWNNGSIDKTKEFLNSLSHEKIRIFHSPKNLGFGGGNNEAIKYAKGDYILFLNNDIVIKDNNWLQKLEQVIKENPKTILGTQYVDFNSATEFRNKMLPYLNGWCLLVEKEFIDKYGAFHPDFGWAYFEDTELSQRALKEGYKLKQIDLDIKHLVSRSSADQLNIPDQFKYNQFVFRNLMYEYEKENSLRIVFFCPGNYEFIDGDFEGKGVGGAESALILLTRELAKLGYVVDVYNNTPVEGTFNGVNYINLSHFVYEDYSDIFVLFRNSMLGLENVYSSVKIFWTCDQQTTQDWDFEIIPFVDKVLAISEYHKKYLLNHYAFARKMVDVIDLGVNEADYVTPLPYQKGKLIYCSVPRRGLKYLAECFPKIKDRIPEAELYITSDYRLWGAEPENAEFRIMFDEMPGVHFLGKISREELVICQKTAEIMAYPCDYDENYCISAIECIAAGAVPVTTDIGALKTTVADSGIVINGKSESLVYQEKFIEEIANLLTNQTELDAIRRRGKDRVLKYYTWGYLAKTQWDQKLRQYFKMKDFKPNFCEKCTLDFPNAYEFFRHRASEHPLPSAKKTQAYPGMPKVQVLIKTTRDVEISINGNSWAGKELTVPQESASDIVRMLTGAYGSDVIAEAKVQMN